MPIKIKFMYGIKAGRARPRGCMIFGGEAYQIKNIHKSFLKLLAMSVMSLGSNYNYYKDFYSL